MITVSAELERGEGCPIREGLIVADTGNASSEIFNGLTDSDEIFKKSISCGYVDHHVIDKLPVMEGRDPKCSTQMVVDYCDDVLKYIKEHNVKEVYIHNYTDLDALCSGWLIKYLGENNKLPSKTGLSRVIVRNEQLLKIGTPKIETEFKSYDPDLLWRIWNYAKLSGMREYILGERPDG